MTDRLTPARAALTRRASRLAGRDVSPREAMGLVATGGFVVLVALLGIIAGIGSITRGSPQPAAGAVAVAAGDCKVAPRSAAALATLLATPVAVPATAPPPSAGKPADAATVAGVTATAREFVACFNAGDNARAFALFSDEELRRQFGGAGDAAAVAAALTATPVPLDAAKRVTLRGLEDVRVLADGRVAATIVGEQQGGRQRSATRAVFVHRGSHWLLDGQRVLPLPATPAP